MGTLTSPVDVVSISVGVVVGAGGVGDCEGVWVWVAVEVGAGVTVVVTVMLGLWVCVGVAGCSVAVLSGMLLAGIPQLVISKQPKIALIIIFREKL